ncbi:FAD-dependent oxidoreductase [Paraburkholderia phenoliruptrix]|uniref:FAD-dependent oxidoreductase n=1 Tax=Paraburkholderia phenoliruptrix TaxID=252970 RepID=UPI001C6E2949|nr:FAD-dependent oxidoreductase [Paraburkholderia phenoliruptrix]MBW9127783.1 FAD-dependent oxidoreductase [Paraburkholderia ginsengiterrae]
MSQHFDVIVVGAGPAGLHAALAAAREGATVALLDDNPHAGGQIWRQGPGGSQPAPLHTLLAELHRCRNVIHFAAARVVAPLAAHELLIESAELGGVCMSYGRLILATGARERLLPFAGWTLPGVTGAGGLQALIKGGMPVRGERVVIAGSGPLLIAALATARAAGARVLAVVEQASAARVARFGVSLLSEPSRLRQALGMTRGFVGVPYWSGSMVEAARGDGRVQQVTIRRGERRVTLDCERVACGFGLVPNIALAQALGCAIDEAGGIVVDDAQRTSVDGIFAAGECTGVGGAELAAVEGELAGLAARGATLNCSALHARRARWRRFAARVETAFALQPAARTPPADDTLLCRCEDVSVGEVRGFDNWRDAKLHTRCGMGACQGKVCAIAANVYFGWAGAAPRPPFSPARIGTLMAAGESAPGEG